MELNQEELKYIKPGIYRIDSIEPYRIPGISRFRRNSLGTIVEELAKVLEEDSLLNPSYATSESGRCPKRTYFSTVEEFLETWMKGYKVEKSQFGENEVLNPMGFELYYANWHRGSPFYEIDIPTCRSFPHYGFNEGRDSVNPLLLCADANGICDQQGYMNLGVNDFRYKEVLVYRAKENYEGIPYAELPNKDKSLTNDKNYYVWDGRESFPFDSANPLKSTNNIWHMIGLSPLDVYKKLEDLKFHFPN